MMKIMQLSTPWERVPPERYGGTELIVSLLSEGLVSRGHDVTVLATADSKTKARLIYHFNTAQRFKLEDTFMELEHALEAFREVDFQILHNHGGYVSTALAHIFPGKSVTTVHGNLEPKTLSFYSQCPNQVFVCISKAQQKLMPRNLKTAVIYNAVDVSAYPFDKNKDDFLLSLSTISPIKGQDVAIEVAKVTGRRLVIAGKIDPGKNKDYFDQKIYPHIDNQQISFLGEISNEQKKDLLKRAICLLFPINWEEPFGLVMAEAMACGTPVIAFNRGSVSEVIVQGETGFVVEQTEEMIKALDCLDEIDSQKCRNHVIDKFNPQSMVDKYEYLYASII